MRNDTDDIPPIALTIAGSDSGGGAGIQADLKTFHALGVFGTSVVTAVTAQNTRAVTAVQRVDPDVIRAQIDAVADDLRPAAVKSGMLADGEVIRTVAAGLERHALAPYVLDPVMVSASGARLLAESATTAVLEALLPLADLVTPNLEEASILSGRAVTDPEKMTRAGEVLLARGGRAVLLKGGHLPGERIVDVLVTSDGVRVWESSKLSVGNAHGTGCTLSAAIAALLARGKMLEAAVDAAIAYTRRAIETAPPRGGGSRPLNHWA